MGDIKGTAQPSINFVIYIAHAICIILTVQYQQKPSVDTIKCQCTVRCQAFSKWGNL